MLRPGNNDDEIEMGNRIGHIFATRPNIAQIHIDRTESHYTLYANKEPVEPQALIEVDEEIDWNSRSSWSADGQLPRQRDGSTSHRLSGSATD